MSLDRQAYLPNGIQIRQTVKARCMNVTADSQTGKGSDRWQTMLCRNG